MVVQRWRLNLHNDHWMEHARRQHIGTTTAQYRLRSATNLAPRESTLCALKNVYFTMSLADPLSGYESHIFHIIYAALLKEEWKRSKLSVDNWQSVFSNNTS